MAISLYEYESPYLAENELLREHLRLLMEEMDARASHGFQSDLTIEPNSMDQVRHGQRHMPHCRFLSLQASFPS